MSFGLLVLVVFIGLGIGLWLVSLCWLLGISILK